MSLEGVDATGGSQACDEGRGEGDGEAAASESCVRDAGGAAVATLVEERQTKSTIARGREGEAAAAGFIILLERDILQVIKGGNSTTETTTIPLPNVLISGGFL